MTPVTGVQPTVDHVVVIATGHLDETMRDLMLTACEMAHVQPVFADAYNESTAPIANPTLVLGVLPVGTRRIPTEVAELSASTEPNMPVLLLCDEPLVQTVVSLQDGRVTLLGQPLSPAFIAQQIGWTLPHRSDPIVNEVQHAPAPAEGRASATLQVREFRDREWWAAAVAFGGRHSEVPSISPPTFALEQRQGFAALLHLGDHMGVAGSWHEAAQAAIGSFPSLAGLAKLRDRVGAGAAGVAFCSAEQRWALHCPHGSEATLDFWMLSASRIPSVWRVQPTADQHGPGWQQVDAAPGDLVLAFSAGSGGEELLRSEISSGALWRIAEGGGLALLDHFRTRLSRIDTAWSSLIVELRR